MLRGLWLAALAFPAYAAISKMHIVYMTHLDAGFTDTTRNVCDLYFEKYFPQAFLLADALKANCTDPATCPTYRWTQFPWLIQEFLDGRAGCAHRQRTPEEVSRMEKAIEDDVIVWHANALNNFNELLDTELLEYSLQMRQRLNARFSKSHGNLVGKLTDVTGMTRAAVPVISKYGVKAFHVGYNGVGGLPILPGQGTPYQSGSSFCGLDSGCPMEAVFRWKDVESETELLMMIEAQYGGMIPIPVGPTEEIALYFYYTMDNGGVPKPEEVTNLWANLRTQYPNVQLVASTLDDFMQDVLDRADMLQIPEVTGEIGDSWLYGAGADPIKVSTFRQSRRFMSAALASGTIQSSWWQYDSYMRRLLKGPPEHNWGLSVGGVCQDCRGNFNTWVTATFNEARSQDAFRKFDCPDGFMPGAARWGGKAVCGYDAMEHEWAEQREWMHPIPSWSGVLGWSRFNRDVSDVKTVAAIEKKWINFARDLELQLVDLTAPTPPSVSGLQPLQLPSQNIRCGNVTIGFDAEGAIGYLMDSNYKVWANGSNVLGQFRYTTYSHDDFVTFGQEWNNHGDDFDKPGMELSGAESKEWIYKVAGVYFQPYRGGCRVVVELNADEACSSIYGPPLNVSVEYLVGPAASRSLVDISLIWNNKVATRLPEALWMSFVPIASASAKWVMNILSSSIDPLDVVLRGTRFMHAVWDGYQLIDQGRTLTIQPLDTPLVAPGDRDHLLRYSTHGDQPDVIRGGMHSNIYNNAWGTAFAQWYDDDGVARWVLSSM